MIFVPQLIYFAKEWAFLIFFLIETKTNKITIVIYSTYYSL